MQAPHRGLQRLDQPGHLGPLEAAAVQVQHTERAACLGVGLGLGLGLGLRARVRVRVRVWVRYGVVAAVCDSLVAKG